MRKNKNKTNKKSKKCYECYGICKNCKNYEPEPESEQLFEGMVTEDGWYIYRGSYISDYFYFKHNF